MRFMTMVKSVEGRYGMPPMELIQGIMGLREDALKAGVFVDMGGLMPTANGAEVRLTNGTITVTDGPFAEAKEVLGGWAVYDTPSKAEALVWVERFLDLHRRYWPEFDCVVEVRQFMEAPPGA